MVLVTGFKARTRSTSVRCGRSRPRSRWTASFAPSSCSPRICGTVWCWCVPGADLSAILGSLNGYVLSQWQFRGANLIFTLMLFGMFIPYQSILIPLVQLPAARSVCTAALAGPDPGPRRLRHPDHDADLPQLLRRHAQGTGRGRADRRCGLLRHLPPHHAADLRARLRRRAHLAVHADLERVPVRRHRSPARSAGRSRSRCNNIAGSQIVEWNVQMAGAFLTALPTLVVLRAAWPLLRARLAGRRVKG